jgi:hypothetical protein
MGVAYNVQYLAAQFAAGTLAPAPVSAPAAALLALPDGHQSVVSSHEPTR